MSLKTSCPECSHELTLDEAKLPSGPFRLKCSKCGKIFTSSRETLKSADARPEIKPEVKQPEPPPVKQISSSAEWERFQPNVETMVRTHIDSAKKEILDSLSVFLGGVTFPSQANEQAAAVDVDRAKRVLICDSDKTTIDAIAACWKRLGYSVDICMTAMDGLRKLEMAFYHAVSTELAFPDEPEGGKQILMKINTQKPDQRRKIFVAIISNTTKTTDPDSAFFHGGNITVNKQDLNQLENYIVDGRKYYEHLYQNFYEIVSETDERL
jgi:CheY-like chemotaxis protein